MAAGNQQTGGSRGLHAEMQLHTETRTREEDPLSISHSNGSGWHTGAHALTVGGLSMGPKPMSSGNEYEIPRMELVDEQIQAIDPDALEVSPDEHELQHAYTMWFSRRSGSKQAGTVFKFEDSLKILATFRSAERFWKFYTHLKFPNELSGHCDYHLFKHGIKPMWEDPANREGGKWIVRLRKGVASRVWENVILAILGEQFLVGDEICGAVMSIRYNQEDIISVWNRTADDKGTRMKIMETLRRVANLPQNYSLEYKRHNKSLQDKSSFRNADETVFR